MKRKSPIKHKVRAYKKEDGKTVNNYIRGKGLNPATHLASPTLTQNIFNSDKQRIKYLIRSIDNKEEESWNYFENEDLDTENANVKIHLSFVKAMTDPVAVFRPQELSCFYGTANVKGREYKVLTVIGTDEGLDDAPIEVGTVSELVRKMKSPAYRQIHEILPTELK